MPDLNDVRAIGERLAGTIESQGDQFALELLVKGKRKGYAWSWRERIDSKKPKIVNEAVIAIRVPNLAAKELLLESNPVALFDEPHYKGYPAVLAHLPLIEIGELESLLEEAWRCTFPANPANLQP